MMSIISEYSFVSPEGQKVTGEMLKGYVALYIDNTYWIIAKGYKLYKYYPEEHRIEFFSKLVDTRGLLMSKNRLIRRLTRCEITKLYRFDNDEWFCIARKAIFRYNKKNGFFEKCRIINRGSRPLNLCQDSNGSIYYGEYFFNPNKDSVHIFRTDDNGVSWKVAYKFAEGEINHIHGIFNDPFSRKIWVFTGDDDSACIAGYTDDGFVTFNRSFSGSQEYRVCVPLFMHDKIVYGTDSQYVQNYIRSVNRNTNVITDLVEIQGSCIYAAYFSGLYLISTTVEPSKMNKDNKSHLWYSTDGFKWHELLSFEKDCYRKTLFQFGSIRFPNYSDCGKYLICTGRALKKFDQNTLIIPISSL